MKNHHLYLILGTVLQAVNLIVIGMIAPNYLFMVDTFFMNGTIIANLISYYFLVIGTILFFIDYKKNLE